MKIKPFQLSRCVLDRFVFSSFVDSLCPIAYPSTVWSFHYKWWCVASSIMCARGIEVSSALIGMLCFWSCWYWPVCLLILFVFFIVKWSSYICYAQYGTFVFFCLSTPSLKLNIYIYIYIYSMISRLFSQLYSCWSINRFLSFTLSTMMMMMTIIIQWHEEERRWSKSNRIIIIISQGVDIVTFHLVVYNKMSIVTNKIDKWREKDERQTVIRRSKQIFNMSDTAKWINHTILITFLYSKMKGFASIHFQWGLLFFFLYIEKVTLCESYSSYYV